MSTEKSPSSELMISMITNSVCYEFTFTWSDFFFIKLSVIIHSNNEISFFSTTFLITVYLSFVYSFLLTILLVVIIHQSDDMFLVGLSSFKGSTTCIPTICGWNNRHSRIPWIENQYSKTNTSRLHSIHNTTFLLIMEKR